MVGPVLFVHFAENYLRVAMSRTLNVIKLQEVSCVCISN